MKRVVALLCCLPLSAVAATVTDWSLPAPEDSAQPNLSLAPEGDLLLSWIERKTEGGHRLAFARMDDAATWSEPRTIAEGDDWFVNWADFPALQALADGSLWAHVLVKNGEAPYAYDISLRSSVDGGQNWKITAPVHDDGTPTEHGFASFWPQGRDQVGIAWLDGRASGGGQGHDGHAGHGGAMALRGAVFGPGARKLEDAAIDTMTCDCCQTDAAVTSKGALLAYRDRSPDEVRDIYVTRFDGKRWTPPHVVHADGWVMPACPVNGPAVAARGTSAWVAWYTQAGGTPSIRVAASADSGASFGPMHILASGDAQQGRLDLAADAGGVWVAWLEETTEGQSLWLVRRSLDLSRELSRTRVATLSGRGRGTGFPRLQVRDGAAWLAWTEVVDGMPRLRGAIVRP